MCISVVRRGHVAHCCFEEHLHEHIFTVPISARAHLICTTSAAHLSKSMPACIVSLLCEEQPCAQSVSCGAPGTVQVAGVEELQLLPTSLLELDMQPPPFRSDAEPLSLAYLTGELRVSTFNPKPRDMKPHALVHCQTPNSVVRNHMLSPLSYMPFAVLPCAALHSHACC
jgi:hypothetical protein